MTLEELDEALEAAPAGEREAMIDDWLKTQPEDLRALMAPDLYAGLALMDDFLDDPEIKSAI